MNGDVPMRSVPFSWNGSQPFSTLHHRDEHLRRGLDQQRAPRAGACFPEGVALPPQQAVALPLGPRVRCAWVNSCGRGLGTPTALLQLFTPLLSTPYRPFHGRFEKVSGAETEWH
jgi:hypothetical protein